MNLPKPSESVIIFHNFTKMRENLTDDRIVRDCFLKLQAVDMTREKLMPFKYDIVKMSECLSTRSKELLKVTTPVLHHWNKLLCSDSHSRGENRVWKSYLNGHPAVKDVNCSRVYEKRMNATSTTLAHTKLNRPIKNEFCVARSQTKASENHLDSMNNPHLNIDASDSSSLSFEQLSTSVKESKTYKEPYSVEMQEGQFVAVKTNQQSELAPLTWLSVNSELLRIMPSYYTMFSSLLPTVKYNEQLYLRNGSFVDTSAKLLTNANKKRSYESTERIEPFESRLRESSSRLPNMSLQSHSSRESSSRRPSMPSQSLREKAAAERRRHFLAEDRPKLTPEERAKLRNLPPKHEQQKQKSSLPNSRHILPAAADGHKSNRTFQTSIKTEKSSQVPKSSNHHSDSSHQNNCDKKVYKPELINSNSMPFIAQKKERRAVYSGRKSTFEVPSLFSQCAKFLNKNYEYWKYKNLKTVPYEAIAPVLENLAPFQLYRIEDQNKHLEELTEDIWKNHCNRDCRGCVRKPQDSWKQTYFFSITHQKVTYQKEQKLRDVTAGINAQASKAKPERQVKLTFTDSPYEPSRKRPRLSDAPSATTNGTSSTKKPSPPKSDSPKTTVPKAKTGPKERTRPTKKDFMDRGDAPLMSKVKKTMSSLAYRTK